MHKAPSSLQLQASPLNSMTYYVIVVILFCLYLKYFEIIICWELFYSYSLLLINNYQLCRKRLDNKIGSMLQSSGRMMQYQVNYQLSVFYAMSQTILLSSKKIKRNLETLYLLSPFLVFIEHNLEFKFFHFLYIFFKVSRCGPFIIKSEDE